eukprot:15463982-Alexandrium_andersonii.AAC.1
MPSARTNKCGLFQFRLADTQPMLRAPRYAPASCLRALASRGGLGFSPAPTPPGLAGGTAAVASSASDPPPGVRSSLPRVEA